MKNQMRKMLFILAAGVFTLILLHHTAQATRHRARAPALPLFASFIESGPKFILANRGNNSSTTRFQVVDEYLQTKVISAIAAIDLTSGSKLVHRGPKISDLTSGALMDVRSTTKKVDPQNEWYLSKVVTLSGLRTFRLETIGTLEGAVRFNVCALPTSKCLYLSPAPCSGAIEWTTPIVIEGSAGILGVALLCTVHEGRGVRNSTVFVAAGSSENKTPVGWSKIEELSSNVVTSRANTIGIIMGPATIASAAFSLTKVLPAGYQVTNFSEQFQPSETKAFSPINIARLPSVQFGTEGFSELALWLDGGLNRLPPNSTGLGISREAGIVYSRVTLDGKAEVCYLNQRDETKCLRQSFDSTTAIKILNADYPNHETRYIWQPSLRPSKGAIVSVMGGPEYSVFRPTSEYNHTLNELGYDVATPLILAGSSSYAHVPAIDPSAIDPTAAGKELDAVVNSLTARSGKRPIMVSTSAGVGFASQVMPGSVSGHIVISGDCFPLETIKSGQLQMLAKMTRSQIEDDGGVAQRMQGNSISACSGLLSQGVPIYATWFKNDMRLGEIGVQRSLDFFIGHLRTRTKTLAGQWHVLQTYNGDVNDELRAGINFVLSNERNLNFKERPQN